MNITKTGLLLNTGVAHKIYINNLYRKLLNVKQTLEMASNSQTDLTPDA